MKINIDDVGDRIQKTYNPIIQSIKNNTFLKAIIIFSAITITAISFLSYFLFNIISQNVVSQQLEQQQKQIESVSLYIEKKHSQTQSFINNVYRDIRLTNDLTNFLTLNFENYIKTRLDQSFDMNINPSNKVSDVIVNLLESDNDIDYIVFYSANQQSLNVFSRMGDLKIIAANASNSYIPDVMASEEGQVSSPNVWIAKAIGIESENRLSVRVPITDPRVMQNIGQLIVIYDLNPINHIVMPYQQTLDSNVYVLSLKGHMMYQSNNKTINLKHSHFEDIITSNGKTKLDDEDVYVSSSTHYDIGYIVTSIMKSSEMAKQYADSKKLIILISIVCILIIIIVPTVLLSNYAKRTYKIIRGMRRVEVGDLQIRFDESKQDELGVISASLNQMLEQLAKHIENVYKAEIAQKNAELGAIQAKINPHFLYNTLEVIRMRSIAHGAHDVSEMIYSLAMLFKQLVHKNDRVTLYEELELCRLYLELFRIRYKDQFHYEIQCNKTLYHLTVSSMIIQPLIENYIVHGMDNERNDNHVLIKVDSVEDQLVISVIDNGKGIEEQHLASIIQNLKLSNQGQSFGLASVDERIKLVYGQEFGIRLYSEPQIETRIKIVHPISLGG